VLLIVSVVPSFTLFILITGFFNVSIDRCLARGLRIPSKMR
jgi:hypothetical protein